jgi:sec-independent protein translocase protein TatB
MFDFDAGKLLIIGVIALIVIGPKDLPRVLRQVGQAVGKLRRMASDFQGQFMDAMKEADIQDIRNEVTKLGNDPQLNTYFDPVRDIRNEMTSAVTATSAAIAAPETPAASASVGYVLPPVPEPPADGEISTLAAAGLAPVVDDAAPAESSTAVSSASVKKRKIVLPKRRSIAGATGHQPGEMIQASPRFRNVRPRRPEATDQ